ncbi:hypothetical protein AMURIS_04716 [Acetatifactor muris]|uniref:Lipoprotein n=1 Tax=Acetatifactor muris TaxID=879566 RepID=A0A2K4ZNB0_9FIRM|nr:hypothetical protein AMURIS_04716 [Acetatifactor muris]
MRERTKKLMSLLCVAALCVGMFAGCGGVILLGTV